MNKGQEGCASGGLREYERTKREAYSSLAPQYDDRRYNNPAGRLLVEQTNRMLSCVLGDERGRRVLDVGAGTGRTALYLAGRGAEVVAYDLTPAMLEIARARARERGLEENLAFMVGTARRLPFGDGAFDAVICIRLLHLIPRQEHPQHLAEMWRVVRKGGTLIYEVPNRCFGLVMRLAESLHRRFRLGRAPVESFWPWEALRAARELGGTRALTGLLLPGSVLLSRLHFGAATRLNHLGFWPPFNLLADKLWVVVRKGENVRG